MVKQDSMEALSGAAYLSEQEWFLSISDSHFGIQQRTVNLLKELQCFPIKQKIVNEKIREIVLNDFWFYKSHPEATRALKFIISLFNKFFNQELDSKNKQRALNTLLDFIKALYEDNSNERFFHSIEREVIHILEVCLVYDKELKIYASNLLKNIPEALACKNIYSGKIMNLMMISLQENLKLWQDNLDFLNWSKKIDKEFYKKYSTEILRISRKEEKIINRVIEKLSQAKTWQDYQNISDYKGFIDSLHGIIQENKKSLVGIYYIYYLFYMPESDMLGLSNFLMTELAGSFKGLPLSVFKEINFNQFLIQTFSIFINFKYGRMDKIIECLSGLGRKIYQLEDKNKIEIFAKKIIDFGFVYPGDAKINREWQVKTDNNYLKMLRLWLEFIEYSPENSSSLINALIINLKIGGVFVKDEDLFQRDISRLLNSDIRSNYFLIKQLVSLFPVFYNSIGAEGRIREISTEIDKLSFGNDYLIHFLRKQVHSESNNTHIVLAKNIFYFWYDGDAHHLQSIIPEDVQAKLAVSGDWFDPVHQIINSLCERMNTEPELLIEKDLYIIKKNIKELNIDDKTNTRKVIYLIELYQLLKHKYTLDSKFIINDLKKSNFFTIRQIEYLQKKLQSRQYIMAIKKIYPMLDFLKEVILNPEKTEVHENIYYKRHIAPGIASMYGQYSETKFEAMGLIFRLEKLVDQLISKIINERNLDYMTIDGFHNAAKILELCKEGLAINDISNENFNTNLEMLNYSFKTTTFSMNQFINIFYFVTQNIKEMIDSYYIKKFNPYLKVIIIQYLNRKSLDNGNLEYAIYKKSEEFYRDIIVSAFLVQNIDNYVSKILVTLKAMVERLDPEVIQMLLNYNPGLLITTLQKLTPRVDNKIFLGAKAYYLKKLYSYKYPVPPGFVLSTELFRDIKAIIQFPEMYKAILEMIKEKVSELEKITGRKYGDPNNPLLLAVRSGTVIPMPGAMDSILNIGMNDEIAESLSRTHGYGWAAWDSYRRLLQNWGMAHGIVRNEFDQLILHYKKIYKIEEKRFFSIEQMRNIAFSYKELLSKYGIKLVEEPFQQLIQAIICVFQSWHNERAQVFRKKLQIAEEWGTAVIVQEMILGNIGDESGTGVVFTRVPFEKSPEVLLYGDFTSCSQGEDIVSGLVYTSPVSEFQNKKFPHLTGDSLEKKFPDIYRELFRLAKQLISYHGYEHQEIEFTFKSKNKKDLHILQTRQYTLKDQEGMLCFTDASVHAHLVGTGIGIGGGAVNGIIAFDLEDIKYLTDKYPYEKIILIRPDTVPDDIEMIFECDALLTARGGVTSHAAVTAVQLGKICIVNCKQLMVVEGEKKCRINCVEFHSGDKISIDASLGNIYSGHHPVSLERIDYLNGNKI